MVRYLFYVLNDLHLYVVLLLYTLRYYFDMGAMRVWRCVCICKERQNDQINFKINMVVSKKRNKNNVAGHHSTALQHNSLFNQRDNCSVEEFSRGLKLSLPPLLVLPLLVLPLWLPWLLLLRTSSNFAHNLFNICMHAGL